MVVDDADRVLMVQALDKRAPHEPAWQLPGGRIKAGEDPLDAALREVAEETGYTEDMMAGPVVGPLWIMESGKRRRRREDHVYVAYLRRGEHPLPTTLSATEERTMLGARWWTHSELQETGERLRQAALPRVYGEFIDQGEPLRPRRVAA
jgi:8-oxo-dGTP pyrophosphatase MutT (NUDIX family)